MKIEEINKVSGAVVDCAVKVHSALGPGLLESVYKACMLQELVERGLKVRVEVALPVVYNGIKLEAGYRIDILVEECVVVELKAIEAINPIHEAQVLTYLKLSGYRVGLLLNFNVAQMKQGIRRFIV